MPVVLPVGYGVCTIAYLLVGAFRESVVTFAFDPPVIDPQAHASTINGLLTGAGGLGNATSVSTLWSYRGVRVTEMDESGPIGGSSDQSIVGTLSAAPAPPNFALLVRKVTSSGGRRNRGRMFFPPCFISEGNINEDGTIPAASVTALQSKFTALRDNLVGASLSPVILHSESPFTPTPVTGFILQALGATQRRRMRR